MGGSTGRFRWDAAEAARIEQEASEKERECVSRSQMIRLAPVGQPKPSEEEIQKRSAACMADPIRFASRGGPARHLRPRRSASERYFTAASTRSSAS